MRKTTTKRSSPDPAASPAARQGAAEPIAALNRVRIVESGEPLVDIREACPGLLVTEECCPYLRTTVARMLAHALGLLPPGCTLRSGTALRTLSMQAGHWDGYYARMVAEHPTWPRSALRRATNRFFAPYDQPAPPGHCTGAAVDVALIGPGGEPMDTTSPLTGWQAAYTWSTRLSAQARANRMLMVEAMLAAGFSNCREEFWHYSWGDSAWAVRMGETACPYGLVQPPVSVEASFAGGRAGAIEPLGPRAWRVQAAAPAGGGPGLLVGVLWADGRGVELHVQGAGPTVHTSTDRQAWTEARLEPGPRGGVLRVAPTAPRLFVSDVPPAAAEA